MNLLPSIFLLHLNAMQVAALFHIGTTKSHPPIPEHLSLEAKDFLLKCLQKYAPICHFFLCIIIQFSKGKTKCVDLLLTCLHNVAGAVPSIAF